MKAMNKENFPRFALAGMKPYRSWYSIKAQAQAAEIVIYDAIGWFGVAAASGPGDCIIDLIHALKSGYRQSSQFLMNDLVCAEVRKVKDTDGNYLWRPGLEEGKPDRLLGYPISYDDNMPDLAANSLSIAFGDFKRAYLILDRVGIRVLRDPYTSKPNVFFYTTKRVGGGVQNFEAVKLMKFAA